MAGKVDDAEYLRLNRELSRKVRPVQHFPLFWQVIIHTAQMAKKFDRIRGKFPEFLWCESIWYSRRFAESRLRGGAENEADAVAADQFAEHAEHR